MKTYLSALFALSTGLAFGQLPDSTPPNAGTLATAHTVKMHKRLRQAALLPADGFWVVEKAADGPAVAHFYTADQQKLRTDTLRQKFPNLKRRIVLARLNKRLRGLLDNQNAPASVAVRQR